MIKKVNTKKELHKFVYFIKELYKDDPYYVFPFFKVQMKELTEIVLNNKTYNAILCEQDGQLKGRLLYTTEYSKRMQKEICYYSYFDCVNEISVVQELFNHMENHVKSKGIDYSEGTFSPFDPDTRRGVMIKGFKSLPSLFTSYNYDYYSVLLEEYGFSKAIDTVLLDGDVSEKSKKRLDTFSKFFMRNHDVRIDTLQWKNLERDMRDIEKVISQSTNEIIYQDAPDIEMIRQVAEQMRLFINPRLVKIVRENESNKPVGFVLVLPDFNQIFHKTNGRIRPLKLLLNKRKITRARGQLQYVIPEYQGSGLIAHIFSTLYDDFQDLGITSFEAGTMMEDNPRPINIFKKFGGEIIKIYRLYGKEID